MGSDAETGEAGIVLEFGPARPRGLPKELGVDTVVQVRRRLGGGGSDASDFPAAYKQ